MKSIKLVFISDIHYSLNKDFSSSGWRYMPSGETKSLLDDFVQIVNDELMPDAVIDLGDRLKDVDRNCDLENTKTLKSLLDDRLNCPCFHINGNHDFVNLTKEELAKVLDSPLLPYAKDLKDYRLLFMDSLDPMISGGGSMVSLNQLNWLETELNRDNKPKLVFSHHPLNHHKIDKNAYISPNIIPLMYTQNADQVKDVLERAESFVTHVSSHMHFFAFTSNYLVNSSFGSSYPETQNTPGYFMELEVKEGKKLEAVCYSLHPKRVVGTYTNSA